MKLARLIKLRLNETYNKVRIGKYLSDSSAIQTGIKHGNTLLSLLFKFALNYAIKKVQETKSGLKLNETTKLLAYVAHVITLRDKHRYHKGKHRTIHEASKRVSLELNRDKTKWCCCLVTRKQGKIMTYR
jgi:hypothetical protein